MLLKAICAFFILIYIHLTFSQTPSSCLDHVKDNWPRDGILRVEIIRMNRKPLKDDIGVHHFANANSSSDRMTYEDIIRHCSTVNSSSTHLKTHKNICSVKQKERSFVLEPNDIDENDAGKKVEHENWTEEYSVEYALEYGLLRLSASARKIHKIPIKIIRLNPQTDSCFGDSLSRFILKEFLGYDDLLMASVKVLAEQEENKGYLR